MGDACIARWRGVPPQRGEPGSVFVDEFAGRHNIHPMDTIGQMRDVACKLEGKRLEYRDLIAPNGLASGARTTVLHA